MKNVSDQHAFVVLAYGRSPYLEECLRSLATQSLPSRVIVSTSTPFEGLDELCRRHGAALHVHGPNRGIGPDWNAALRAAGDARLVTLAHQDDLYLPDFVRTVVDAHGATPAAAFSFCDSEEVWPDGRVRTWGLNHRIKRLLIAMATFGAGTMRGQLRRQLLLGFGNPIICATVTFDRSVAPTFAFREDLRTNMDWLAWSTLSRHAPVIRVRRALVRRRVHEASETARCIVDGSRLAEDRMIFASLWPSTLARGIAAVYRLSYRGYLS
ncbi:glycosyltransferase [Lysobacter changpingensis]|uniref:glycosyltransferase n=1 Tax=Lysobacter changpingensis TaxID=2792784 RepID=UPI001A8EB0AB|nr:glycosyltransferase family A protein [Lysobacter changpingensis]